ncbi:GPI inositol-deacylase [Camellia lanceoleosa]|uniref:GPI inositol-deacylase n=1 Tax=Camellia lanceoleosa TaxID=1840588 RepID=A0ACC0G410_9ERIC|nr:GPI inositol-deacylase [Camellia lanceoleosa]
MFVELAKVRTKLESLDGIVPPSHGFFISSTAMKNVRLSMEHQVILWSNQLVVQVSHTLLSLIDAEAGQPFFDTQKRLAAFTKMLHSGMPLRSQGHTLFACPSNVRWTDDDLERDLYIQTSTVTVLAMDGRRWWLDIEKLIEPGSQTEQAPPSAVFFLAPGDMHGFRFLTISVAPSPTVSRRPPPAASMAVGQFFRPKDGELELSPQLLLLSTYSPKDIILKEDHPLAFNMSFAISLGLFPVKLSLETTGCGIKKSGSSFLVAGLCKLHCFPPVALAWDATSGLHIFPNLYSETVMVDSSPVLWSSTQGSEKTTILLLVDPHCSYKASVAVPITAAAERFLLLYGSEVKISTC